MSIFLPETWPFPISLLPQDAHLVGGSVRDQLLQRQGQYLDLDFVVPNQAVEAAAAIAKACHAGFVVLDETRQIARAVFDNATVDFAQQQGGSLEADLRRRDFTINAIAYHPRSQSLIDPLGGQVDLTNKIIRMVSAQNLAEDPLRLMRAHRQAAQLSFQIDDQTQAAIHQLAPKLQHISIERVRSELDALLSLPAGTAQLASILKHQLLSFCLTHFDHSSLERVIAIDSAMQQLSETRPDYANLLHQWVKPVPTGCDRSWIKAAKLSQLLSLEAAIAQTELIALAYSRAEIQSVTTLLKLQPTIDKMKAQALTRSEQFFLFKQAGDHFPAVFLLALAQGVDSAVIIPMVEQFLDPQDLTSHPPTLLSGHEIMQQLNLKPGKQLGQLIRQIEQAQAEGDIRDKESAILWLKKRYIAER